MRTPRLLALSALLPLLLSSCEQPEKASPLVGRASGPWLAAQENVGSSQFRLMASTRRAPRDEIPISRSDVCFEIQHNTKMVGGQCGYLDFPVAAGRFRVFRTEAADLEIIAAMAPSKVARLRLTFADGSQAELFPAGSEFSGLHFFFDVLESGARSEGPIQALDEQGAEITL